jgi:hypothetical protein
MVAKYRILLLVTIVLNAACLKQKFPSPADTNSSDPEIFEHRSIAELCADMGSSGTREISGNIIISGIVVADDRQGNFYKQIIIDDGTAAIPVLLDAYNLYNDFPVGRNVSIKCKGLYTGFYYKLPQLGFAPGARGTLASIPYHLWDQYLVKGSTGNKVPVTLTSMADIKKAVPQLYNRLIMIQGVQFADTNTAQYAQPASLAGATSVQLMDCDSNTVSVRTSGYSSFQFCKPPKGRGTLSAIYTVFNNTPQLVLRDTADVQMRLSRCF